MCMIQLAVKATVMFGMLRLLKEGQMNQVVVYGKKKKAYKTYHFTSTVVADRIKTDLYLLYTIVMFTAQQLQLNITHRFFETGHGQSVGYSMHSNIERELKHRVVYTPDQIYTIITNAKVSGEKYNIKEMMQTEFYNIKELINNKNWIKDAPHL